MRSTPRSWKRSRFRLQRYRNNRWHNFVLVTVVSSVGDDLDAFLSFTWVVYTFSAVQWTSLLLTVDKKHTIVHYYTLKHWCVDYLSLLQVSLVSVYQSHFWVPVLYSLINPPPLLLLLSPPSSIQRYLPSSLQFIFLLATYTTNWNGLPLHFQSPHLDLSETPLRISPHPRPPNQRYRCKCGRARPLRTRSYWER